MHIGSRIKKLVEETTKLNHKQFAEKIGHTEQSMHGIYKKEDLNTGLLKRICEALNISISEFFAEPSFKELNDTMASRDEVIEAMKTTIKALEHLLEKENSAITIKKKGGL